MEERVRTDRLEDLPTRFLRCRVYGHSWDDIPATLTKRRSKTWMFPWYDGQRCTSCDTERYDGIDGLGGVGNRYYDYPHGYLTSFKMSQREARLEYLRRQRVLAAQGMRTDPTKQPRVR